MDPADTERFRLALSSQGDRVGQHERVLHEVMEAITNLTSNVALIGGRMDQFSAHLTTLTAPSHAPTPVPDPAPPPPPAASPGPSPTQPREPFIPTPARFTGQSGSGRQFLFQCSLVFEQQPSTYATDKSRVAFVMSLLSEKAAAWAVALSLNKAQICFSFSSFSEEFLKVFDHPLRSKEASSRLLSLRQGENSAAKHSIDFRILAIESGWDERALQGVFLRGLRDELRDELAARDETNSLDDLISLSIRLDCRLSERRRERSGGIRHTPPVVRTMSPPRRGLAPSPITTSCSDRFPPRTAPFPPGPEEPMQLGTTRLTPRERQRRQLQGLCVYCGQNGHLRVRCPVRPKEGAHQPPEERW